MYCDLGDRLGQANVLKDLGMVQWQTGDYPAATAACLRQALALYQRLGSPDAERVGKALVNQDLHGPQE